MQSVRRLPEDQKYNSSDLAGVVGLPWKLVPTGDRAKDKATDIELGIVQGINKARCIALACVFSLVE